MSKIGILGTNIFSYSIIDHYDAEIAKVDSEYEIYFASDPLVETGNFNTSPPVRSYILNKDIREKVASVLGFSNEKSNTLLYSIYDGNFNDFLEISYQDRLMSGNIGPVCGVSTSVAMKVTEPLEDCFTNFKLVSEFIQSLDYKGEISLFISKDFKINNIVFGHFPAGFSLYSELAERSNPFPYKLYDSIVCGLLVSSSRGEIKIPINATKHVWKYPSSVFITVWGKNILECKKRMYRTLNNLSNFNSDLMYRNDLFHNLSFVSCYEKYKSYLPTYMQKE
jgi:hypothetical protein